MSLFQQASAVNANAGGGQAIHKTTIDPARVEDLANAIEAKYEGMTLNSDAIAKGGVTPTGKKVVIFAAKRRLPTPGAVTVYYNGTCVWAGLEPIVLPKNAPAPEPTPDQTQAPAPSTPQP